MNGRMYFEDLASEAKNYADLRIDELKLKATSGLSLALGQILSMLLVVAVLVMVAGLLAYAALQWLNSALGAPWGTLIVCFVFIVILAVLMAFRKKMFRNMFVKLFIDVFYDPEEDEQQVQ